MKVHTSAHPVAELARILHGAFRGTITAVCERGRVVCWEVDEDLKPGHIRLTREQPRDQESLAGDLETVLANGGTDGFTGRLDLLCNDGYVTRYRKRLTVSAGAGTDLVE